MRNELNYQFACYYFRRFVVIVMYLAKLPFENVKEWIYLFMSDPLVYYTNIPLMFIQIATKHLHKYYMYTAQFCREYYLF